MIVLSAVILSLGLVMTYLIHVTVDNLKYDAGLINQSGVVRGSIQRVVKLVLSDSAEPVTGIIMDINFSLERFVSIENGFSHIEVDENVFKGVIGFKKKWQGLEHMLIEYQTMPSPQLRKQIIEESERCWDAADAIVLAVQQANEDKVSGIKLFYVILLFNAASAVFIIWLIVFYVRKILEYEAAYDHLTRVGNRRSYDAAIESEVARCGRYNQLMSLVLFDVDRFKEINDKKGHRIGDDVLVSIARVVSESIRKSDSLYRLGGDEFAIIIPGVDSEGALKLADKIRNQVAGYAFGIEHKVTISLGVAEFYPQTTKDNLYRNADMALYQAKSKGRNCSVVFITDTIK